MIHYTSDIDKKIEKARQELVGLELTKRNFEELGADKKLAIRLHAKLCHWNHTDGCGWFYESDTDPKAWLDSTRADYLRRAQKVITLSQGLNISENDIFTIVDAVTTSQYKSNR